MPGPHGDSEAQSSLESVGSINNSSTQIDPADTAWAQWKNWANFRSGRFDEATKHEYLTNYDKYHEESDCRRCEKERDYLLRYSMSFSSENTQKDCFAKAITSGPQIRFMQEKLEKLGGQLNEKNIVCQRCPELKVSGFDPDYGIQLCANRLRNRSRTEDALAHGIGSHLSASNECSRADQIIEMIHAYDHLRFKLDWDNDLKHAACTEIRASSLSGECRFVREFFTNGIHKIANQHQNCVKRRATLSLLGRPFCKNKFEAEKAVNSVWESCFADTRPFDEIYK